MAHIPRDERTLSDTDFLNALDPKRRDLAKIRRARDTGDLDGAKRLLVDHFRTRQRPNWFFDLRSGKRGTVTSAWPDPEMGDPSRTADLLENRFVLRRDDPSLVWDFGKDLRWHTAEMRQLASTPYRLKRGSFFRDLTIAYAQTGRPAYASKFAEFVNRWRADWPLVVGPEFHPETAVLSHADGHDTMTTAYRWLAWVDALYGGIAFAPQVSLDTTFGLLKSLWFIAVQYQTYAKSKYVPANHHLWERGTAPLIFGIMLPEFPDVSRLVKQAKPVIARHIGHSFLADGGYEERSAAYTISALHMFLIPLRLAALNRIPLLDRRAKARLRKCGEMIALLTLPDGTQPDIGDGNSQERSAANLLGASAHLLKNRTAADVANRLRLKKHAQPEDRPALKRPTPKDLPLTVHYPASGYFVARDAWTPRASALALSVPGPGIPNHAHDDALTLQLIVRGEPVVGTPISELYSYFNRNRQAKKRAGRGHLYAMTSHNVVLVGGQPARSIKSLISSWGPEPTPVETSWKKIKGGIHVVSAHQGYPGVTLSREITFRHRRGWTVRDRVKGSAGKPHVARWHFEYGVEVIEEEERFVAVRGKARLGIHVASEGNFRTRLYRDRKWLGSNPLHPDHPAPWVIDVRFGGTGDDAFETRFEILT